MAKESGIGMTVAVDDSTPSAQTITNDITNLTIAVPRGVQDVTGLDKSAPERLLLLADGNVTLNGVFNDATNMSHAVFKTVSTTSASRTITIVHSAQTFTMESICTDYALTRAADGSLTFSVPAQVNNGTAPSWS